MPRWRSSIRREGAEPEKSRVAVLRQGHPQGELVPVVEGLGGRLAITRFPEKLARLAGFLQGIHLAGQLAFPVLAGKASMTSFPGGRATGRKGRPVLGGLTGG